MEKKQVVEVLKKTATKSKVANDVFHAWALRERTRNVVTVEALAQRMKKEGYEYPNHEYAALLRQLSQIGLGKLETSATGKVKALTDVRLTLQSIGQAAVGDDKSLTGWRPRNKFGHLMTSSDRAPELPVVVEPKRDKDGLFKTSCANCGTAVYSATDAENCENCPGHDEIARINQEAADRAKNPVTVGVSLNVSINGKSIHIQVPDNLTVQEVSALVAKLKGA